MKYVANPVVVDAFRILGHEGVGQNGSLKLVLEDGQRVTATPEMLARMKPGSGDYWVIQSDGYIYLNPKEVFERKYSPVQESKAEIPKVSETPIPANVIPSSPQPTTTQGKGAPAT